MFTDRGCPLPYITWLILDAPTQFDGRDVPSIGLSNKHVQQRKAKSESEQRPTLYVPNGARRGCAFSEKRAKQCCLRGGGKEEGPEAISSIAA